MFGGTFKKNYSYSHKRSTLNKSAMELLFPEMFTNKRRYQTHNFISFIITLDFISFLGVYYYIIYLLIGDTVFNVSDSYMQIILEGFFLVSVIVTFIRYSAVYRIETAHDWFANTYSLCKALLFSFIFIKSIFLLSSQLFFIQSFLEQHLTIIFMFLGLFALCMHLGYLIVYRTLTLSDNISANAILFGKSTDILAFLKNVKKLESFSFHLNAYYFIDDATTEGTTYSELQKLTRINNICELKRMRHVFNTYNIVYCVPQNDYKSIISYLTFTHKFMGNCNHIICNVLVGGYTLRSCNSKAHNNYASFYTKMFNIVVALTLQLLTSPLVIMAYIFALIKNFKNPIYKNKIRFSNGHIITYLRFNLPSTHFLKSRFIDKFINLHHVLSYKMNIFGPACEDMAIDKIAIDDCQNQLKEIFNNFSILPGLFGWRNLSDDKNTNHETYMQAEVMHLFDTPHYLNVFDKLRSSRS